MDGFDYFIITGFSIIALCGTVGNAFVIYVFQPRLNIEHHLSEMDLLILYLAIIDIISSILNPALFIYWQITAYNEWVFGQVLCKLLPGLQKISVTLSLGMILLIILERTLIIVKNRKLSKRKLKIMVVVIAVVSVLTEYPTMENLDLYSSQVRVKYQCFSTDNPCFLSGKSSNPPCATTNQSSAKILKGSGYIQANLSFLTTHTCNEIVKQDITMIHIQNNLNYFEYEKKNDTDLSILKTISDLFKSNNVTCNRSCDSLNIGCTTRATDDIYFKSTFLILRIVISMSIVIVCNVFIYRTLYDRDRTVSMSGQPCAVNPNRIFRLLAVIAFVFIVLVFPKDIFVLSYSLSWLNGFGMNYQTALKINEVLTLIQTSNCVCNVFIYARLHIRVKHVIERNKRNLMAMQSMRTQQRMLNRNRRI